jgi:phosphatidylinositol kinase/protein kinase (PI-3  family)
MIFWLFSYIFKLLREEFLAQGRPKSIREQVQQLIEEAMDPQNLCRLYLGWCALW